MLMKIDLLTYSVPKGDFQFVLNLSAPTKILRKAIDFDDCYSEIYGHRIFLNLDDIKKELKQR